MSVQQIYDTWLVMSATCKVGGHVHSDEFIAFINHCIEDEEHRDLVTQRPYVHVPEYEVAGPFGRPYVSTFADEPCSCGRFDCVAIECEGAWARSGYEV